MLNSTRYSHWQIDFTLGGFWYNHGVWIRPAWYWGLV